MTEALLSQFLCFYLKKSPPKRFLCVLSPCSVSKEEQLLCWVKNK